jgi:hypothetical protein
MMRIRAAFVLVTVMALTVSAQAGTVDAESIDPVMPASVYFVTMGSGWDAQLRVSLSMYWGVTDILVEEIWFDDIEGNAHHDDSWRLSNELLSGALGVEFISGLSFVEWTGERTFVLHEEYQDLSFSVEHHGRGKFTITTVD